MEEPSVRHKILGIDPGTNVMGYAVLNTHKVMAWGYDLYFSHILPAIGRWLSRDKSAYTYLNKSVKHFIWGEKMTVKLAETGFRVPRCTSYSLGIASVYKAVK